MFHANALTPTVSSTGAVSLPLAVLGCVAGVAAGRALSALHPEYRVLRSSNDACVYSALWG